MPYPIHRLFGLGRTSQIPDANHVSLNSLIKYATFYLALSLFSGAAGGDWLRRIKINWDAGEESCTET